MKTKFTNTEIVHIFANQTQEFGDASNLFFRGNKIYSYGYHYLLGEFIDPKTIVLNNRGYSRSTERHLSLLWRAIPQGVKIYWSLDVEIYHAHSRIKDNFALLINSKTKGAYYKREILSIWERLNEFIKYRKDKNTPKDIRYKEIKKIVKDVTKEGNQFDEMLRAQKEAFQKRLKQEREKAIKLEK